MIATNFQFEIPTGATIRGITFSFNHAADTPDLVADYSVHVLQDGAPAGFDRGSTTTWPITFAYQDYGGQADTWGLTWTPAQVNSAEFGVALTPLYLDTGGNARGYVDFIKATVTYCPRAQGGTRPDSKAATR